MSSLYNRIKTAMSEFEVFQQFVKEAFPGFIMPAEIKKEHDKAIELGLTEAALKSHDEAASAADNLLRAFFRNCPRKFEDRANAFRGGRELIEAMDAFHPKLEELKAVAARFKNIDLVEAGRAYREMKELVEKLQAMHKPELGTAKPSMAHIGGNSQMAQVLKAAVAVMPGNSSPASAQKSAVAAA